MRALPVLLLLLAPAAAGDDLAALARRVKHYPTKFRLIAAGRAAVPHLMAQLADRDDPWLVFESKSAVRWIAHHERDKASLAGVLAGYCGSGHPPAVRVFAAEVCGDLGVPATVPVVARALKDTGDPVVVDALRRIPGDKATDALVAALGDASDPLKDVIYGALGARGAARTLAVLTRAAHQGSDAALRALADTGLAEAAGVLRAAAGNGSAAGFAGLVRLAETLGSTQLLVAAHGLAGDDESKRLAVLAAARGSADLDLELVDLVVRDLETPALRVAAQHAILSIADRAGPGEAAPFRRSILEDASDRGVIVRAMAACAHGRDPQAVPLVVRHLGSSDRNIRTTAISALRDLPGARATDALVKAYGRAEDRGTLLLLIDALGDRGDPAAAEALTEWMQEGDPDLKRAALDAFVRIADRAAPARAAPMYLRALRAGATGRAVDGLARTGDASVLKTLADVEGPGATEAIVRIAARLAEQGDRATAKAAYRTAYDRGAPVENSLRALGERVEITARDGLVSAWWMIGPFPAPDQEAWAREEGPETGGGGDVDLDAAIGGRRWKPVAAGGADAVVALDGLFEPNELVTAYAFAEIWVKKERPAVLKMGSDDGIRCWVNGALVHFNPALRGVTPGEDTVPVQLKEGRNELLVKVCEAHGGWGFCVKIEDDQGRPLKFRIR